MITSGAASVIHLARSGPAISGLLRDPQTCLAGAFAGAFALTACTGQVPKPDVQMRPPASRAVGHATAGSSATSRSVGLEYTLRFPDRKSRYRLARRSAGA